MCYSLYDNLYQWFRALQCEENPGCVRFLELVSVVFATDSSASSGPLPLADSDPSSAKTTASKLSTKTYGRTGSATWLMLRFMCMGIRRLGLYS